MGQSISKQLGSSASTTSFLPAGTGRSLPPLKMAQVGHKELMRVMTAAGYEVVA